MTENEGNLANEDESASNLASQQEHLDGFGESSAKEKSKKSKKEKKKKKKDKKSKKKKARANPEESKVASTSEKAAVASSGSPSYYADVGRSRVSLIDPDDEAENSSVTRSPGRGQPGVYESSSLRHRKSVIASRSLRGSGDFDGHERRRQSVESTSSVSQDRSLPLANGITAAGPLDRSSSTGETMVGDPEALPLPNPTPRASARSPSTPDEAQPEQAVMATAVTRDDLEDEIRQQILSEVVQAEAAWVENSGEVRGGPAESKSWKAGLYRWRWWIFAVIVLIVAAVVVGVVVGSQSGSSGSGESDSSPVPTSTPTNLRAPTASPTSRNPGTGPTGPAPTVSGQSYEDDLLSFLKTNSIAGDNMLNQNRSPAKDAYGLILTQPQAPLDDYMIDRFALLTFFYMADGHVQRWVNSMNWQTSTDPCTWFGVECDASGLVESIQLPGNSLTGRLSPTLGMLGARLKRLILSDNALFDLMPKGVDKWTGLQHLDVSGNSLRGSFTGGLAVNNWRSLEILDLGDNAFTGTIPPVIGELSRLRNFSISINEFSGVIPEQIVAWRDIEVARFDRNGLSGTMPAGMCTRKSEGKLVTLTADTSLVECGCCD